MQKTVPIVACGIQTTESSLVIRLHEKSVEIPWETCSEKLSSATPAQRNNAELSPSGYGIRWSEIDEDLSITGLMQN